MCILWQHTCNRVGTEKQGTRGACYSDWWDPSQQIFVTYSQDKWLWWENLFHGDFTLHFFLFF